MKFKHVWPALAIAVAAQCPAADAVMKPSAAQVEAAAWSQRVLERYRYKPQGGAPAGAPVLEAWVDALDTERMVFTEADLRELGEVKARLEKPGAPPDLEVAFGLFDWYRPRYLALIRQAREQLRQPMAFDGAERYRSGRAEAPRAANEAALRLLWRQRVMDDVLRLRLAGCAEQDIVPILERRYDRYRARLEALTPTDVFELFMNAWLRTLDPDGRYTAPPTAAPKGSGLAGVGLTIRKRDERIEVFGVAHGGAAAGSGQLKEGDRIVGVAREAGEPARAVTGWSVDEVVELLRGAPGSSVALEVLPAGAARDAQPGRVTLVRDTGPADALALQSGVVQARIETLTQGGASYRLGIIDVPPLFYEAVVTRAGARPTESASGHVAGQLRVLKQAGVDAVLLDLRNNGGGTLKEAVRMTGLFLPGAATVQQLGQDGKLALEKAAPGEAAWDGPLAVLADKGTAAGAEIFAAALQDHGRALVLGDPSYGRSTIQVSIPLDRFAPTMRLGQLSMTIAQAFRVDGSHFEGRGVTPDIVLPGALDAGPVQPRQAAYPAAPQPSVGVRKDPALARLLPELAARHAARSGHDARYQSMLAVRARELEQRRAGEVSLNAAERRRLRDAWPQLDVKAVQLEEALRVLADAVALGRGAKP